MTEQITREAPSATTDCRPCGQFELLVLNETVSVKVISVAPGHRLSLQRHEHRDEWWQVLDEGLVVEVGDDSWACAPGERVWVPRGSTHRVSNSGSSIARFLEVAFGEFDECDIERLEDDYCREDGFDEVRCA